MDSPTTLNQPACDGSADSLHRLVRPFERDNTAAWRERERIVEAMDDIRNLADEIHICMERSRSGEDCLRQATVAIGELEVQIKALWPNP